MVTVAGRRRTRRTRQRVLVPILARARRSPAVMRARGTSPPIARAQTRTPRLTRLTAVMRTTA
jgi:hypothetical protein